MATTDVTLYNEQGDAVAVVKRDSTSSQLPEGAANQGIVLMGGVEAGTPDTFRALRLDNLGRILLGNPGAAASDVKIYDKDGNGITSTSISTKRAIDVAIKEQPVANPGDSVWEVPATAPFTTNSTAKVTVCEFVVPSGKEFYVAGWSLAKLTNNNISGQPGTIEVVNASNVLIKTFDKSILDAPATGGFALWQPPAFTPILIAVATQKVRLTITPSGNTLTEWFGKILGITRST